MNRTKKITAADVIRVTQHLESYFKIKITDNKDSEAIEAIAEILDILGVKNKKEFMKNVSITIYKNIYLSFTPGDSTINPLLQLEIIAHEVQHALQWESNPLEFSINYLTKHEKRTEYEVKALSCNLELHYRITKELYNPKDLAASLKWYKCTSKDIKVAEKHLAILANILKQGGNYSIPVEYIMTLI
jgi:hypothetical protein